VILPLSDSSQVVLLLYSYYTLYSYSTLTIVVLLLYSYYIEFYSYSTLTILLLYTTHDTL
jgi:hypothetical protein